MGVRSQGQLVGPDFVCRITVGSYPYSVLDDGNSRLMPFRIIVTEKSYIQALLVEVFFIV